MEKKYTVLCLFSGSGGKSLGFKWAGFRSVGNLDYDPRACADLERGVGEPATRVNIAKLTPAGLRRVVRECPDVAAMSAPCVGFSGCLAESLAATDKYQGFNDLALHGIQLLLEAWKDSPTGRKVPGLIVFENVPRIKSRGKELLRHIVGLLHKSGYSVHMASHICGEIAEDLSQGRPRFLLVARHMAVVIRAPDGTCHRPLTDAELALLQGFPIGFEFCGPSSCAEPLADGTPQTGRRKRIGNAVPPPAAYAIARECWDTLAASEADGFRLAGGDIWVEPEERAAC